MNQATPHVRASCAKQPRCRRQRCSQADRPNLLIPKRCAIVQPVQGTTYSASPNSCLIRRLYLEQWFAHNKIINHFVCESPKLKSTSTQRYLRKHVLNCQRDRKDPIRISAAGRCACDQLHKTSARTRACRPPTKAKGLKNRTPKGKTTRLYHWNQHNPSS